MSDLHEKLEKLVEEYGLSEVYGDLRTNFEGYCGNCGTPLNKNEIHQPGNLGMCYIETSSKRKPRRDDGKAQNISREGGS